MQRYYLLTALLAYTGLTMAQDVKTHSVYDANQNDTLDVSDVTTVVEQVRNHVSAQETKQYVTAEDLKTLLEVIDSKLKKLEKLESIKKDLAVIEKELDLNPFNGRDYVDLEITNKYGNKVFWATCNVGAENPEDWGDYFAWGETEPKESYKWSSYKYNEGTQASNFTKYCNKSDYGYEGFVDNKSVLESEDDVATVSWGGKWRMPTSDEMLSLVNQCYWEWVTEYRGKQVCGYVVYKAKHTDDRGKRSYQNPTLSATYSADTDTHIFLPNAGIRNSAEHWGVGEYLFSDYWSSSLNEESPYAAAEIYFQLDKSTKALKVHSSMRYYGHTVRPVCVVSAQDYSAVVVVPSQGN